MKRFCVIGHPIVHSKSPALHAAGFREFDIDAEFIPVDVAPDDLSEFLRTTFRREFDGAAVTVPHKETIRAFVDIETKSAEKIGAINTLSLEDGQIVGTNTDAVGALKAILTHINPKEKNVLLLGAGGAARAVLFGLKTAGANVIVWNRTHRRAEKLVDEFGGKSVSDLSEISAEKFDLIINTTTVGLKKWESLLPESFWLPSHTAFDIVYDPFETKFLSDAQAAGAAIITGDKMLVYQAIEQFKLWHGKEPEPEVFERAFFL